MLRMWLLLVATSFAPLVSFAYDTQNQTTTAYDRSGESAVGYDSASVLATGAKKNGTVGDRVSFAKSAEFLAAKGGIGPVLQGQAKKGSVNGND